MSMHRIPALIAYLSACLCAALLAGCAGLPGGQPAQPQWQTPGPRGGVCDAAPAQGAMGKQATASVIEKARVASGAAMARVLRPNQPMTLEMNPERLNLVIDGSGRITAVRCG